MAEIDKKPEIRFTGFTDAWEQFKFEDNIVSIQTGTNLLGAETNNGIPLLKMGNIQRGFFSLNKLEYLAVKEQVEKENIVQYGDFLFNTRNTLELVGKGATWTGNSGEYAFNSNVARFVFNGVDTIFFNYLYNTQDMINQVHARAVGTTSVAAVYPKSLNSLEYKLPKIEEQKKIGELLFNIENLITLQQRKYDKLVIVKKSMFEKMFPKDGANVPEIRFAGFADDWEQKKLGDISERVKGNDGRMDLPTLTISAGSGWLDQRDRFYTNIAGKEQENYTLLSKGELSYNHGNSKLAKYGIVFELRNYEEALVPRVYHSFRVNKDTVPSFIEYLFATKLPDKELGKLISSGARMDGLLNISFEDFMGIPILVPEREEQDKIGNYFRCLDNLINIHQRELEKLKNIKQSLLEKMFA